MEELDEYIPRNREKARSARYGQWWCWTCDRDVVGDIGKCSYCGRKHELGRVKYDRKRVQFGR